MSDKVFTKNGSAYISSKIAQAIADKSRTATVNGNWEITDAIRLPSNFTLILEDAHLRMADGVYSIGKRQRRITPVAKKKSAKQPTAQTETLISSVGAKQSLTAENTTDFRRKITPVTACRIFIKTTFFSSPT